MNKNYNRSLWMIAALFVAALQYGCAGSQTHESTGEYVDDSAITAKVKSGLASDSTVSALDVHVETYKGTVSLSGFVDTQDQKSRAATIAKNVAGVQHVENKITVK
jgi:osmotically-inducible protein OsmY